MTGISPEREAKAFEMFAGGATTREVATALGIGNGTAARALQRYRGQQDPAQDTQEAAPAEPDMAMTDLPDADLAELRQMREALTAEAVKFEERAQASRTAVTQLEYERREALAAGREAQQFRVRLHSARDDAADSEESAGIFRQRLADVDQQIGVIVARQELGVMRAQLAEAVTARDAVYAQSGDRQRAAVLAVRDAAADITAVCADEAAAARRVDQLADVVRMYAAQFGEPGPVVPVPVSTVISVPPDLANGGAPLALARALNEARAGNVAAVAVRLGEACGYLPPSHAQLAAEADRLRKLAEDGRQAEEDYRKRMPQQKAPVVRHYDERGGASYSVDSHGNPLREPTPNRPPMEIPEAVRPAGSLGFQSFG